MRKFIFAALSALCALTLCAEDVEPIYIVNIDADAALDDCQVSVTQEGSTTEVAFSTLSPTTGTFKKRGVGTLTGSTRLANFTGNFLIEEGAYRVNANGMLGPYTSGSTVGTVTISNGASFVFAYTVAKTGKIYNTFYFEGSGTETYPGALYNACTASQQDSLFYNDWILTGDATVAMRHNSARFDISGHAIRLNDHTLLVKQYGSRNGGLTLNGTDVKPGAGHLIFDGTSLQPQSYGPTALGWTGGATNTVTFRNGAYFSYYGYATKPNWTMIAENNATISPGGGSAWNCGHGVTNTAFWRGPIQINNGTLTISGDTTNRGYAAWNTLSGTGSLYMKNGWLHLFGASTLEGTIKVEPSAKNSSSGLYLAHARAANPNGAGIVLTNAALELARNTIAYELPDISAHITSSATNFAITGGKVGTTAKSLTKSGSEPLTLDSPMNITGNLTLSEGTLVLPPCTTPIYSTAAGLWKGSVPAVYTNAAGETVGKDYTGWKKAVTYAPYMTASLYEVLSNEVSTCMDLLKTPTYPPWEQYDSYSWGGYIWNRNATNEQWTFALSISGYSRFYFDGVYKAGSDNNNALYRYTYTVTPGPHAILFKVNPRNYNSPGANSPASAPLWKPGLGLGVDMLGRNSTNVVDYILPENAATFSAGGNGFYFTRDTRDVTDFTEEELTAAARGSVTYSNIVARAGTILDLGEGNLYDLPILTLSGVTTVQNGGLAIFDTWSLKASDILASAAATTATPLTVNGKLTFAEGAQIKFLNEGLRPTLRPAEFTLATATGGIVGSPTFVCTEKKWSMTKAADGKSLILRYTPAGLKLTFY